jgi:hypothetical protein
MKRLEEEYEDTESSQSIGDSELESPVFKMKKKKTRSEPQSPAKARESGDLTAF